MAEIKQSQSLLQIENTFIKWSLIDSLKTTGKQFRKHSKRKIERLAKQLKHFKIFIPIVVNADNEIVAGFARFSAAKILGLKTLPVIQVSHLTPEELEAYKIAENQSVMFDTDWNLPLLKLEFQNFEDIKLDLELTGFEIPKIDVILNESNEKSDNQEEIISNELETLVTKRVKSGDIWQLGEHKLLCADSTKIESF
ncbi:ParB N-terminal domain-containing protein [bacterium]|nr:ParB N-terminal domain-containing protein [bacterium]